jgi:hypothetical protein
MEIRFREMKGETLRLMKRKKDLLDRNGLFTAKRGVLISRKSDGGRARLDACLLLIVPFSELM